VVVVVVVVVVVMMMMMYFWNLQQYLHLISVTHASDTSDSIHYWELIRSTTWANFKHVPNYHYSIFIVTVFMTAHVSGYTAVTTKAAFSNGKKISPTLTPPSLFYIQKTNACCSVRNQQQ
jgi:hypothetical protein